MASDGFGYGAGAEFYGLGRMAEQISVEEIGKDLIRLLTDPVIPGPASSRNIHQ